MDEIADDQEQIDELVQAVGWAIYEAGRAREISEVAVRDTGFGNVADKITKKRRTTAGTLDDLLGAPSVGVIDRDEDAGLTVIAKPVGVVGAVVPSSNPGTTLESAVDADDDVAIVITDVTRAVPDDVLLDRLADCGVDREQVTDVIGLDSIGR